MSNLGYGVCAEQYVYPGWGLVNRVRACSSSNLHELRISVGTIANGPNDSRTPSFDAAK